MAAQKIFKLFITEQYQGWHAEDISVPVTLSYNSNMAHWVQWCLHLRHTPCAHCMSHQTLNSIQVIAASV